MRGFPNIRCSFFGDRHYKEYWYIGVYIRVPLLGETAIYGMGWRAPLNPKP